MPALKAITTPTLDGRGDRYTLWEDGRSPQTNHATPLSVGDVLSRWQTQPDFRTFFSELLAASPYVAYRWETPPMTRDRLHRPFEWVLINDPSLERPPEPHIFRSYFSDRAAVVTFENLGGDALLVVPSPRAADPAYGHLSTFIRHGPTDQVHDLWRTVGQVMEQQITTSPRWLNTAGDGVAWLHVRVDTRPKYYAHTPYKQWP